MRPHLLVPLFLLATACIGGSPLVSRNNPLPIDGLRDPYIEINWDTNGATFQVRPSDCPTLVATAKMNGKQLEQIETGGVTHNAWPYGDGCVDPTWRIPTPPPDEEVTNFEVFDSTGRLTFGVRHLGATRGVVPPDSGPVALRWGEPAALRWTPATDDVDITFYVDLESGQRKLHLAGGVDELVFRDGAYQFRMPAAPPDEGDTSIPNGTLVLQPNQAIAGVDHCEPYPGHCTAYIRTFTFGPGFTLPASAQ